MYFTFTFTSVFCVSVLWPTNLQPADTSRCLRITVPYLYLIILKLKDTNAQLYLLFCMDVKLDLLPQGRKQVEGVRE
jgi:hypothetical protein